MGSTHWSTCFIFGIYNELLNIYQRSSIWVKARSQELSKMVIGCQVDKTETQSGCELWEQRFLLSRRENRRSPCPVWWHVVILVSSLRPDWRRQVLQRTRRTAHLSDTAVFVDKKYGPVEAWVRQEGHPEVTTYLMQNGLTYSPRRDSAPSFRKYIFLLLLFIHLGSFDGNRWHFACGAQRL